MLTSTIDTRLRYAVNGPSHFLLHLAAMRDARTQTVRDESLVVLDANGAPIPLRTFVEPSGNRIARFDASAGEVRVIYRAVAERSLAPLDESDLREHDVTELPDELLVNLLPTRLCDSDVLSADAQTYFGQMPRGISRVRAVIDWVQKNIEYRIGSSGPLTSATEIHAQRAGVCRDFAHLCIAFCRALNIPARFVVGYTIFDEPPQDFHAIFEVWLGRWVAFDPTGLADPRRLIRVGLGRDAKDVAFVTMYGPVSMTAMQIRMTERDGDGPVRVSDDSSAVMGDIADTSDEASFSITTNAGNPAQTVVEAVS